MKGVQYFSKEYLEECQKMSTEEILEFLEQFRLMQAPPDKSQLISIKIPRSLLSAFKQRSVLEGVKYQTQIKNLMRQWLDNA